MAPDRRSALPRMKASLAVGVTIMGGTMLLLQIVLTRELLASFSGNELTVGLILVAWLLLVGAGSALGGRLSHARGAPTTGTFAWLQIALLVPLPLSVLAAQAAGGLTRLPGQVLGPLPVLALSAAALALPCLLLGAQFAVACAAASGDDQDSSSRVTTVYVLEAAGAVLGGLLFHFGLADHLSPVAVACGLALVSCIGAAVAGRSRRVVVVVATLGGAAASVALAGVLARPHLAEVALSWRWRGLGLVETQETRYGSIAVTRREGQLVIYENGSPTVTTGLLADVEASAHLPLLEHPHPRRVLVIGGGLGGLLREVLKHPVERVDYVELDPTLVRVAGRYLPPELAAALRDPRLSVHIADGRRFVKTAQRPFDVVLVNLAEPTTILVNRYYTAEFDREVARLLGPDGLLSFALPTPNLQLYRERQVLHSVLYAQLAQQFAETLVVPGDQTRYVACRCRGVLTTDPEKLAARLRQRGIRTEFLTPFALRDMLSPFRRDTFQRSLAPQPGRPAPCNLDLHPLCAFLALSLWTRQYGQSGGDLLRAAGTALPYAGALPVLVAALLLAWRPRGPLGPASLLAIVAITGLLGMAGQMVVLIGFQAASGYLFHEIGLLMTLFMLGLTAGAAAVRRTEAAWLLPAVLAGLCATALGAPLVLRAAALHAALATPLLGGLSALLGFLTGAVFPLAVAHAAAAGRRNAPDLYAADLVGASVGGLVVGTVAIPLRGLPGTCLLLGTLAASAVLLALRGWRHPQTHSGPDTVCAGPAS